MPPTRKPWQETSTTHAINPASLAHVLANSGGGAADGVVTGGSVSGTDLTLERSVGADVVITGLPSGGGGTGDTNDYVDSCIVARIAADTTDGVQEINPWAHRHLEPTWLPTVTLPTGGQLGRATPLPVEVVIPSTLLRALPGHQSNRAHSCSATLMSGYLVPVRPCRRFACTLTQAFYNPGAQILANFTAQSVYPRNDTLLCGSSTLGSERIEGVARSQAIRWPVDAFFVWKAARTSLNDYGFDTAATARPRLAQTPDKLTPGGGTGMLGRYCHHTITSTALVRRRILA